MPPRESTGDAAATDLDCQESEGACQCLHRPVPASGSLPGPLSPSVSISVRLVVQLYVLVSKGCLFWGVVHSGTLWCTLEPLWEG